MEIKIFMVCDVWLDGRDAQTIHIQELFKNLVERCNTHLFAPKLKKSVNEAQNVIFVQSVMPIYNCLFYQIFLFFYLIYYCFKLSPDVIYTRHSSLCFSPVLISKIFRIPYIVEVNGLIIDEMIMWGRPKLLMKIAKLSERTNYKQAKKIVAVTQGVKEGIKELYNIPDEKIVIIGNGANTDLFKPMDISEARKELKFDTDSNYVCFVGALAPWQGIEYFVQSAPLILDQIPNTKFLVVGDGPMKEGLINLAEKTGVSDKFIFSGAVPYEKIPLYINTCEVCVAPFVNARNKKIGLSPLKMWEYLACGKPAIASDISGVNDLLEESNAGIVVPPENLEEFAKAIIKLLKNEKLREEMGKNGREYVVKNHSWELVAKRVAEVCESAAKEHKNKRD
jgi:glycosyltransferase involved in cell wall biosynthesis